MSIIEKNAAPSTSSTFFISVIEEGTRPSLAQIDSWFKKKVTIFISEEGKPLSGRIFRITPCRSGADENALIRLEGCPFGIYVNHITSFRVETQEDVSSHILLDASFKNSTQVPTITIKSDGEEFILNRNRLIETIPYFKTMLTSSFRESGEKEIDISEWGHPFEFKQLLIYLEGKAKIEKSNVLNLLILSDFLGIDELTSKAKTFLIQNLTKEEIDFLKERTHPVIKNFIANIKKEIISFYLKRTSDQETRALLALLDGKDRFQEGQKLTLKGKFSDPVFQNILRIVGILEGKITSLTVLNPKGSDVSGLLDVIPDKSRIESLEFSWDGVKYIWDGLGSEGTDLIGRSLPSFPSLKTLKLCNLSIKDDGLKSIARVLASHSSIEVVDLSLNEFSSEGFEFLLEEIIKNPHIRVLELTTTGVGSKLQRDGSFVRFLFANRTLEELHMERTHINDEGAIGFSQIIRHNTHLKVLDLRDNQISLEGRAHLIAALQENTTLRYVAVNSIREEQNQDFRPSFIVLRETK